MTILTATLCKIAKHEELFSLLQSTMEILQVNIRKREFKTAVEWDKKGKGKVGKRENTLQFQLISIIMSLNFINLLFGGYKDAERARQK